MITSSLSVHSGTPVVLPYQMPCSEKYVGNAIPPSLQSLELYNFLMSTSRIIPCLSEREWNVAVLYHMLNLSPHFHLISLFFDNTTCYTSCKSFAFANLAPQEDILTRQREQNNPIYHQHRPEYRHIEELRPCAGESDANGASSAVPKLELWQATDKRAKFFVARGWQRRFHGVAVFEALIL